MEIFPWFGLYKPAIKLIKVDFPEPEGPKIVVILFFGKFKLIQSNTFFIK